MAIDPAVTADALRQRIESAIHEDLEAFGFALLPVKQEGLRAAAGTTPFNMLFLGFSGFIIAAALMLVALLFRLSVEQRASDAGLLLAVGLSRRTMTRLFLLEGLLISLLGAVLGAMLGVGYAALMLAGLRSWWLQAVVTPFLRLAYRPSSLATGAVIGVLASLLTIAWTLRSLRNVSATRLLAGQAQSDRGCRLGGAPREDGCRGCCWEPPAGWGSWPCCSAARRRPELFSAAAHASWRHC